MAATKRELVSFNFSLEYLLINLSLDYSHSQAKCPYRNLSYTFKGNR